MKDIATFGGGCFWCVEAVFQRLRGVTMVESGYMGGQSSNPTYRDICTGTTGHAEIIQISFDPEVISYETLLDVFWTAHDPTTLNRQGNDVGTQYRSVIFYHNEDQKAKAERSIDKEASDIYDKPIVTEISPASTFYPAEKYHHNYFNKNGYAPYCRIIISPKVAKLKQKFTHLLKDNIEHE
jgi:peptide-methionine (S)-S-oxide reductase